MRMCSVKFFLNAFSSLNFDNFVSANSLYWIITERQNFHHCIAQQLYQCTREFHCACARELFTRAVLLRVLSKFAQNLASTRNHSRTPHLTATNFLGSWPTSACFLFLYLLNRSQHMRHRAINYIFKNFPATALQ